MKSIFSITLIFFFYFSTTAFGQATPKMKALQYDPVTTEMAAKADVYIIGKKISNAAPEDMIQTQKMVTPKRKWRQRKK